MSQSLRETYVGLTDTSDLTAALLFARAIAEGFRCTKPDRCDYFRRAARHPSLGAVPSSSEGTQGSHCCTTRGWHAALQKPTCSLSPFRTVVCRSPIALKFQL